MSVIASLSRACHRASRAATDARDAPRTLASTTPAASRVAIARRIARAIDSNRLFKQTILSHGVAIAIARTDAMSSAKLATTRATIASRSVTARRALGARAARKTTRRRAKGDEATTAETALAATNPTDKKYVAMNGVKLVVDFEMHYETKFGETVCVLGSHEAMGAWELERATALEWHEGSVWKLSVELPAGGVFFYKYIVKGANGEVLRWQDGSNSMLVLPESWNVPNGSHYLVEDNFAGVPNETTEISEHLLAGKLVNAQGEKTELLQQLEVQKTMTQTALEELLLAREDLARAQSKLLSASSETAAHDVNNGNQNGFSR